jgi:hypothetical protein
MVGKYVRGLKIILKWSLNFLELFEKFLGFVWQKTRK